LTQRRESLAQRVIGVARQEGLRGLLFRSLSATLYRRVVLVARDIDAGPPVAHSRLALELGFLTLDDLAEYVRLRPDTGAAETERRLLTGQRCVLARHRGEIVSARWVSTIVAEIDYLGLSFDLPPGVAYVHDVYTAPAARGRGISSEARRGYEDELRRAGIRRLLGSFMPENVAGLGLVTGAGYRRAGMIGCVRLPGVRVPVRRLPVGYLGRSRRRRRARRGQRPA
jgi:GNAT superfamily N-acetyltransferase